MSSAEARFSRWVDGEILIRREDKLALQQGYCQSAELTCRCKTAARTIFSKLGA